MKTKTLVVALVVFLLSISGTVFADKDTQKQMDSSQMISGMMNMDEMQKHMTKMQGTMAKIQNTKDEKERQKLMSQHMKEMHKGMGVMQSMVMDKMNDMKLEHEGKGSSKGNMGGSKDMITRQNMMDQRLDVMQSMMGQMMNHMMEQNSMDKK